MAELGSEQRPQLLEKTHSASFGWQLYRSLSVAAIALLVLVGRAEAFTVEWSPVTGAIGYDVERSVTEAGPWTVIGTVATCAGTPAMCSFVDAAPPAGCPRYRVVATNAGGRSPSGTFVGICTPLPAPVLTPPPVLPTPPPSVDAVDVKR
jgi:hypothetical protein